MKSVIILLTLLFSFSVVANDGGSAYLEVLGVDPSGVKPANMGWDKPFLSIYGKEAAQFAKTLPAPSTVALGMMSQADKIKFLANERSLTLFSKGWMLSINCSGGELKMKDGNFEDDYSDSMYYVVNTDVRGFRCNFNVVERGDMEPGDWLGDAFKFKPIDQETNQCQ